MLTSEQIFQLFLIGLIVYIIIKYFVLREAFIEFDAEGADKLEETEREQLMRRYQSDGYSHDSTFTRTYNYQKPETAPAE